MQTEDLAQDVQETISRTVTKFRLTKIMIERDRAFIAWEKGHLDGDEFVADFADSLEIVDEPEQTDDDGKVVEEANPIFSNFVKVGATSDFIAFIRTQLRNRGLV